ncbi:hypothetical protein V6N13_002349 [Hibiscus sabdariffa]|uniref:Uncharacterized protein n=1 Tax=Hibiscus sabdariffa TaxID=183260 RepID=A0ABR2C2K5_9ROSI
MKRRNDYKMKFNSLRHKSFIPGVIVYFLYDLPKGLDVVVGGEQLEPVQSAPDADDVAISSMISPIVQASKPSDKRAQPMWFKI